MELTWIEISKSALIHNLKIFRDLIGDDVILAPAVKANAYGHGLVECARVLSENGADYLCVDAIYEAVAIRKATIKTPLLILGHTPLSQLEDATKLNCDLVVYNKETIQRLSKINRPVNLHLKIETGTNRQGIAIEELDSLLSLIKHHSHLKLMGTSTHFANIEDRINHQYALRQLEIFNEAIALMEMNGCAPLYRHCANTAATILLPEARFNFVRTGIGNYGLWPSVKTKKAVKHSGMNIALQPVLTWKTIVAQVKKVKKGALVGYGCTHEMPHAGHIVVLPVGYYDGYVRAMGNKGYVLIRGKKAPVIGRICMNMFMADVSAIPKVKPEDEVVLLGTQGDEKITAEQMAKWTKTINYEVPTRINERIPRVVINS